MCYNKKRKAPTPKVDASGETKMSLRTPPILFADRIGIFNAYFSCRERQETQQSSFQRTPPCHGYFSYGFRHVIYHTIYMLIFQASLLNCAFPRAAASRYTTNTTAKNPTPIIEYPTPTISTKTGAVTMPATALSTTTI